MTKMELGQIHRKTRKLMIMYGTKRPKADVDRLCLQKYEGEGDMIELEVCIHGEAHSLEKYLSTLREKFSKVKCPSVWKKQRKSK